MLLCNHHVIGYHLDAKRTQTACQMLKPKTLDCENCANFLFDAMSQKSWDRVMSPL